MKPAAEKPAAADRAGPAAASVSPAGDNADATARLRRQQFLRAETAIRHGDKGALDMARATLVDYPLLPWLEALHYEQQLAHLPEPVLESFLLREGDAPHASRLRAAWLQRLATRNQRDTFLKHYRVLKDLGLDCHYYRFSFDAGPKPETLAAFTSLWVSTGRALPAACKQAEKIWAAAGERSEERIWTRLKLAVEEQDTALVKELKALLPKADRPLADLWLKLRRSPAEVGKAGLFKGMSEQHWRLKADALERLAWGDRDKALALYDRIAADNQFPADLKAPLQRIYALALATAAHARAPEFLAAVPESVVDERLAGWRIIDAMRRDDWNAAAHWLDALSPALAGDARWQYFRARTDAALNKPDAALARWRTLASEPNYYGFLARAQLGEQVKLPAAEPVSVAPELLASVRALPGLQCAREWLALDRIASARREWYALLPQLSHDQLRAAALLAAEWNWPDRSIAGMNRIATHSAWDLRFPMPHREHVQRETRHRDIDHAWAYAITRQESLFMADAKSSAGAMGLMQLMPATAELIAKRYRIPYKGVHELLQPATNIRLGVATLADLIKRNKGNWVYATAAYNAGQSRVDRWHRQFGHLPMDIWVETIPFRETQGYVKNVMAFSLIYAERLGHSADVFSQLAESARALPPAATNSAAGGGNTAPQR